MGFSACVRLHPRISDVAGARSIAPFGTRVCNAYSQSGVIPGDFLEMTKLCIRGKGCMAWNSELTIYMLVWFKVSTVRTSCNAGQDVMLV